VVKKEIVAMVDGKTICPGNQEQHWVDSKPIHHQLKGGGSMKGQECPEAEGCGADVKPRV
jgi:hypothetical protein